MVQKTYTFQNFDELVKAIEEIKADEHYEKASGVLLQLYNPKVDTDDEKIVAYINDNCTKACLVGITCANIADIEYDIKDKPVQLNVTYFFKTKLYEMDFDMSRATGFEAGLAINAQLEELPNERCMLVCYSCSSEAMHSFVHEYRHHKLPMFGARAGRSIRALNPARVYGTGVSENGIVAVIMASDCLHVHMDNCLGFVEVGVEMTVTQTEGDNIITTIDHRPATEVYKKYLRVKPNKYFVQNVCEFPFIFHNRDCVIARVPSGCRDDGAIMFTANVYQGDTFRLSYGNADNLFNVIDQSIESLKRFKPEAVFLYECGNRVRFLREDAYKEIAGYLKNSPEASVAIGYAELFITPEGNGGALNSAMVAVGLSEGERAVDNVNPCFVVTKKVEHTTDKRGYIPFMDRILNFLETTSLELDSVNKDLGAIAYTDQLTKIYNRWELKNKLEDTLKMCEENGTKASLIFMDIDHFKGVNDTYGHDVGDMVLRGVVNVIKEKLKSHHIFGRWGGEEFIYILPETDIEEAAEFAEMLRSSIEAHVFEKVKHVTMSFGVTWTRKNDTTDSFVKRADAALYTAKETGRNKVVKG